MNLGRHDIHIWHGTVTDVADTGSLSSVELEQAARFVFDRDRRRYLTTRVMLRDLLSRYESGRPDEWRFTKNDFGKPSLENAAELQLYFNISHTSTSVTCALARQPDIGIDIEDHFPKDHLALADSHFSPEERDWLAEAPSSAASRAGFLSIWTLKEAYIKAVGKGLSIPLQAFSIVPVEPDRALLLRFPDGEAHLGAWEFRRWKLTGDVPMALAYPRDDTPPNIQFREYPPS